MQIAEVLLAQSESNIACRDVNGNLTKSTIILAKTIIGAGQSSKPMMLNIETCEPSNHVSDCLTLDFGDVSAILLRALCAYH